MMRNADTEQPGRGVFRFLSPTGTTVVLATAGTCWVLWRARHRHDYIDIWSFVDTGLLFALTAAGPFVGSRHVAQGFWAFLLAIVAGTGVQLLIHRTALPQSQSLILEALLGAATAGMVGYVLMTHRAIWMPIGALAMAAGFAIPTLLGFLADSVCPRTIFIPAVGACFNADLITTWVLLGPILGLMYATPLVRIMKQPQSESLIVMRR